jgi:hypothetical protein
MEAGIGKADNIRSLSVDNLDPEFICCKINKRKEPAVPPFKLLPSIRVQQCPDILAYHSGTR